MSRIYNYVFEHQDEGNIVSVINEIKQEAGDQCTGSLQRNGQEMEAFEIKSDMSETNGDHTTREQVHRGDSTSSDLDALSVDTISTLPHHNDNDGPYLTPETRPVFWL